MKQATEAFGMDSYWGGGPCMQCVQKYSAWKILTVRAYTDNTNDEEAF